ncbi:preprotein translocase subunit SecF [Azospirillum sp. OGB3]|uniref:protein translocase subunit SecF n=1 Tax=Azospirillum sp. OGB3 TaxID=2587012 RepID=UPI001605C582|nr:protein translocase subunit SecF [Azospirillum sp. OGB3]MBB3264101.1 preprotein translocase subunit SecF [Azospirillum sp. OGB3]
MFRLRLVPDNTNIQFMRGRHAGLIVSAFLSIASVVLFFYPGLNYGIDFRGGIVIEARTPQAADFASLRHTLTQLNMGQVALQEFGSPQDVLIRLERQPGDDAAQQVAADKVRATLAQEIPGTTVRRVEAVGASVSGELFFNGMLALGLALLAMLVYIWFRFEWQFGFGAIVTLLLDVTKVVGFYAITGMQFNLTAIAAILTIMGYSTNDKVVVYDRMRENLRIYKKMPLRELIDRSINETLNRTLGTSMSTLLSILPLAFFGGEALQDFGIVLIFGIFLATSSSIFIAAPILLFLGENRLRRNAPADNAAPAANPTP